MSQSNIQANDTFHNKDKVTTAKVTKVFEQFGKTYVEFISWDTANPKYKHANGEPVRLLIENFTFVYPNKI